MRNRGDRKREAEARSAGRSTRRLRAPSSVLRRPSPSATRRGFTLVELLVVMGIIVLLSVMTFTMINVTAEEDRINSAAADVQGFLAGARDRAIYTTTTGTPEARGVRFLLNTNGPADTVASMTYVGQQTFSVPQNAVNSNPQQGLIVRDQSALQPMNRNQNDHKRRIDAQANGATWDRLWQRGLLGPGARIQIAVDNNWYTLLDARQELDSASGANCWPRDVQGNCVTDPFNDQWRLTREFQSPGKIAGQRQAYGYRLELAPAVLPNQEPRLLPSGVVIDLDESEIPPQWDSDRDRMEILFSPNGRVTGPLASAGKIHLVVADASDVELGFEPGQQQLSGGEERNAGERIVSISPRTGNISVHPVGPRNDPFRFAETGEVTE